MRKLRELVFPCVAVLIGGQLETRMYNFRGSSVRVGAAVLLVLGVGVGVGLLASPAHAKAKPVKKKAAAPVSSGPVTVTMALDVRVVSDGLVDTFKLAGDYRIDSIPKSSISLRPIAMASSADVIVIPVASCASSRFGVMQWTP